MKRKESECNPLTKVVDVTQAGEEKLIHPPKIDDLRSNNNSEVPFHRQTPTNTKEDLEKSLTTDSASNTGKVLSNRDSSTVLGELPPGTDAPPPSVTIISTAATPSLLKETSYADDPVYMAQYSQYYHYYVAQGMVSHVLCPRYILMADIEIGRLCSCSVGRILRKTSKTQNRVGRESRKPTCDTTQEGKSSCRDCGRDCGRVTRGSQG